MLACFSLWSAGSLFAQDLSPSVIVPQAEVSETEYISLEWTIGEVFTETADYENGMLTQGSEQPILQVDRITSKSEESKPGWMDVQVYPNPVERTLKVAFSSEESKELEITLTNLSGKLMLSTTGDAVTDQLELDLSRIPAGNYFLSFKEKNGAKMQTYKVTKIRD